MIEKDFVTEGLKRTKINEYLEKQLERAGYGGMEIQVTPLGTMIVVYAERPGMVIGRGGKTVRAITQNLKTDFGLENPQVEVKEVEVPELNPKIMAHKISNMLQRGMNFRRVAYTTIRRIMGAGAQGVEVTISGKIRGSRSACSKFTDGYIKKCGEPAEKYVRKGFATVQLKPGVLGIYVRIMPPNIVLPDKIEVLEIEVEEPAEKNVEAPAVETTEEVSKPEDILEEITEEAPEDAAEVPEEPVEEVVESEEPTKSEEAAEVPEEPVEEPAESEVPEEPAESEEPENKEASSEDVEAGSEDKKEEKVEKSE